MMQVFLPFPDFRQSVACLDRTRLGNQIWRECKTLLNGGWANHPAARMWADYKPALAQYCLCGLEELERRACSPPSINSLTDYFCDFIFTHMCELGIPSPTHFNPAELPVPIPPFIGNEDFHRSHRLNLLYKLPSHYSRYFTEPVPTTKPEYIWPLSIP